MTKQEILQYVLDTPHNTNITILEQKIDEYVGENSSASGGEKILYMDAELLNAGGEYPVDADDYTTAVIPAEATFVSLEAFANLTNLDTLIINGNCEFEVFEEYDNHSKTTVPYNTITKNRIPVRKLIVQNRTESVPAYFMRSIGPLLEIVVPCPIARYAFTTCSWIRKMDLDGVTSIGERAFEYCAGLIDVTIPESVTSIEDCAFFGCTNMKSITIPASVTYMGSDVFLASGVETIRGYAGSAAETFANEKGYTFEVIE